MGRNPRKGAWPPRGFTPGRRSHYKNDTLGVGSYPNCPDRNWCVAGKPQTPQRGDPGQSETRTESKEEPLPDGGERNGLEEEATS